MSRDINEFLGMSGIPNLAVLGIDNGIDMDYLRGNEDEDAQANDHESNIDDEELDSEESEGDQSEEKEESKAKPKKKQANESGKFAVPRHRGRPRKTEVKSNDGLEEDEEMNEDNNYPNIVDLLGLSQYCEQDTLEKKQIEAYVPFKVPVLFRSIRGGVRYKLSEILIPRDPVVREANFQFNREYMKNKLLSLGNEASKEIKRKLKESLKSREDNQIKTIKEASMRLLLNDYLYFKSDLSLKSNERILKDMMNEIALNKLDYRNVKEIKSLSEQSSQHQEQKHKKIREFEDEEKENKYQDKRDRSKSKHEIELMHSRGQMEEQNNIVKVTFCLRRENLLLSTAERARGLNDICKDLNENISKLNNKDENDDQNNQSNCQVVMSMLNPLKNQEILSESIKNDIINKANLDCLYPKIIAKEANLIESESIKFLETFNFQSWGIDKVATSKEELNNQANLNKTSSKEEITAMDKEDPKKNYDDLFADDSPKMKHKDSQEDDLFADESPKKKSEYSEDLFENPKDDKPDKHSDMSENSDEFGDSNNQSEANIELEQNKLQGINGDVGKLKSEVGDIFLKCQPKPKEIAENKNFRYFGEVVDADSIYQIRYEAKQRMKSMVSMRNKTPFTVFKSKRENAKILDKNRGEYCKNKKLIESKIFEDVSMYKFRNRKLEDHIKLGPLIPNYYTKVNSENKIEKVSLILETDNKARKDSKFLIEENMDKIYDSDIREIMNEIDVKGRKNLGDRDEPETMQVSINEIIQSEDKKLDESKQIEDNDIDEVSSIDSDTKDEEKKYRKSLCRNPLMK